MKRWLAQGSLGRRVTLLDQGQQFSLQTGPKNFCILNSRRASR